MTSRIASLIFKRILPWGRLLDEGAYPVDDVAGSIAVLDDIDRGTAGPRARFGGWPSSQFKAA